MLTFVCGWPETPMTACGSRQALGQHRYQYIRDLIGGEITRLENRLAIIQQFRSKNFLLNTFF